jgi:hypothetical protein
MEIELKGSYRGVKKFKELKNPDILYSMVDGVRCDKNKLTVKKNNQATYYVYHSYNSIQIDYSGRWYNTKLYQTDLKFDDSDQTVTYIIPEFDQNGSIKNNVPAVIHFTPSGYSKMKNSIKL